jgi:soluble lytic murein transglycosylase-like protein
MTMGWICVAWMAVLITLTILARASAEETYDAVGLADQVNRMIEIESAGDPNCIGPVGERGLLQIRRATWRDICEDLDVEWSYDLAFDPAHTLIAGAHYWRDMLPRYLRHYGLPDSPYLRLAAYNGGIGNVVTIYNRHGREWFEHIPPSVRRHCRKWINAKPRNYLADYLPAIETLTRKEAHGQGQKSGAGLHR